MIQSKRGLLLVAVFTAITGIIALFPARVAYHWASPEGIAISGIHGTVWRGSADAVGASGVYLGDIEWRIKPLRLFTAKAVFGIEASPGSGFIEGDLGVGLGGTVSVSNLVASLPLQMFEEALRIRGLRGSASLQFESIALLDALPVVADGTLQVSGLVAPRLTRESIGGYRAEFFTQESGISASVEDTDGVVDIAGSLQLSADGSYQFIAQLVAKPEAPEGLKKQLQYLPPANDRGQQELRIEGSL